MNKSSALFKNIPRSILNPLKHRKWIDLQPLKVVPPSQKFKMMSFNMLNQSYMWPQVYDSYVDPEYRSWGYRVKLLTNIINNKEVQSDIMCFQEMETAVYHEFWNPMMQQRGFDSCFIKKTKPVYWDKESNHIDGVSIFYNTKKFELLDMKKFQISKYFKDEFENLYDLKLNDSQINTIFNARNQVGLIVALKHLDTDQIIIVANTHLYWKYNDIKLLQVMVLLEALNKFKNRYPGSKILFSGDFNSRPNSSVYHFLKNDKIDTSDPDISKYLTEKTKKFILNPVEIPNNVFEKIIQQDKLFTCFTQHLFGIFDYIWFNDNDFQLLKFLSGVDQEYLSKIKGLPNEEFPSDHIPLVAEFELKI